MEKELKEFLTTEWGRVSQMLVSEVDFVNNLEFLLKEVGGLREKAEERIGNLTSSEAFTLLAIRQLHSFLRLCQRDGTAPLVSTIVYLAESNLYDLLLAAQAGKKQGAEEGRERLEQIFSYFEYEWDWQFYIHTLVSLQRINKVLTHQAPTISGFAQWSKRVKRLVDRALAMKGALLNFNMPSKWLYEGLVPCKWGDREVLEVSRTLRDMWKKLSLAVKEERKPPVFAIPSEEEIETFTEDFYEIALREIQERLLRAYKIPPLDEPLTIRVVWGEEASLTQSVAYYTREDGEAIFAVFKPVGKPVDPIEEFHLLFHEVLPGHAYAVFLQRGGDVDDAGRLPFLAPMSFLDVHSVFHEGWAVFAQDIGVGLFPEKDELAKRWLKELLAYLERALVVEAAIPLYTVKPFVPRLADPFQFASYFWGYILWKIAGADAFRLLMEGSFPAPNPTPSDVLKVLRDLY